MTTNTLPNKRLSTATIFGIKVNSGTYGQVLDQIVEATHQKRKPLIVFTPNPAFILKATKDNRFKEQLNQADVSLPDGVGFVLFSGLMGWGIKKRVAGSDIVRELLEIGNTEGWSVGLVGMRGGVTSEIIVQIKRLSERYANITFVDLETESTSNVAVANSASAESTSTSNVADANVAVVNSANTSNQHYNLILACHGMVRQENWILTNKNTYQVGVMVGVGGSLDFLTGFTKRAPVWVQKVGFEWLWRVGQKPKHIKRALKSVIGFGWLVLTNKLGRLTIND